MDGPQASVQFLHLAGLPRFSAMLHSCYRGPAPPLGEANPNTEAIPEDRRQDLRRWASRKPWVVEVGDIRIQDLAQ
jgi:hypothetical protein